MNVRGLAWSTPWFQANNSMLMSAPSRTHSAITQRSRWPPPTRPFGASCRRVHRVTTNGNGDAGPNA